MAKKKTQPELTIETSKGEGPLMYGGPSGTDYDIKWLKSERSYHPDAHYVVEYEKEYGEIL